MKAGSPGPTRTLRAASITLYIFNGSEVVIELFQQSCFRVDCDDPFHFSVHDEHDDQENEAETESGGGENEFHRGIIKNAYTINDIIEVV